MSAKEWERQVVGEVSATNLWNHTAYIAAEDRLSGSEGEARAVRYFKDFMENLGLDVKILETENFISLPIRASITVLSPTEKVLPCITHSFSITTPPGGLEAELVYAPRGSDPEVKGKLVLSEGLAAPAACWHWQEKGAIGQLWINSGDQPRNMIITTVWGQPTPETAQYIPKNAVVSMNQANGDFLKSLCEKGTVRIRLETETWTGFKDVPLAIADLQGTAEPDKYVLYNGHIDSWHRGASDNATANACMLETARILAKYRENLRRGVRFLWWSGHSHGRYSGSNWYADHNWEDLHRNAVVNLNVDSLGCQGATDYSTLECSAEVYELGRAVIEEYTGQSVQYHRIGRSGDQSFWGIGIPALFQLLSRQPLEKGKADVLIPGLAWFWHTEEDTIDKIDRHILLKDAQIYMASLWRLCKAPVLPLNFVGVAEEFITNLTGLQRKAGGHFDLGPALERAHTFRSRAEDLHRRCQEAAAQCEARGQAEADQRLGSAAKELNRCLMELSRILMPVNYCAADRFDADRAIPIPPLPRLQAIGEMAAMDPNTAPFKFLERKMVRERTRVIHALGEAVELVENRLERTTI